MEPLLESGLLTSRSLFLPPFLLPSPHPHPSNHSPSPQHSLSFLSPFVPPSPLSPHPIRTHRQPRPSLPVSLLSSHTPHIPFPFLILPSPSFLPYFFTFPHPVSSTVSFSRIYPPHTVPLPYPPPCLPLHPFAFFPYY